MRILESTDVSHQSVSRFKLILLYRLRIRESIFVCFNIISCFTIVFKFASLKELIQLFHRFRVICVSLTNCVHADGYYFIENYKMFGHFGSFGKSLLTFKSNVISEKHLLLLTCGNSSACSGHSKDFKTIWKLTKQVATSSIKIQILVIFIQG